jgi:hypothetical protein
MQILIEQGRAAETPPDRRGRGPRARARLIALGRAWLGDDAVTLRTLRREDG